MHILAPFLSHHSSHKYSIYNYLSRYHQFTNHASVTLLSSFLLHLLFHFYLPPSLILPSVLPHPLNLPLSLLPSSLHLATIPLPPFVSILTLHCFILSIPSSSTHDNVQVCIYRWNSGAIQWFSSSQECFYKWVDPSCTNWQRVVSIEALLLYYQTTGLRQWHSWVSRNASRPGQEGCVSDKERCMAFCSKRRWRYSHHLKSHW